MVFKCLLFLLSYNLSNTPCGCHGLRSSDIVLAATKSPHIELHTCAQQHTHTEFDKVLGWAGLQGTGYWWAQGYGVWLSGKYPTHTLNKDDGEREIADPQEQILVFIECRFTCSTLLLFQTLAAFQLRRPVVVSGHFHWCSPKLFVLTSQLMFTAKHSCWVRRRL